MENDETKKNYDVWVAREREQHRNKKLCKRVRWERKIDVVDVENKINVENLRDVSNYGAM